MTERSDAYINTTLTSVNFQKDYSDQFFSDGIRLVDYILVYEAGQIDQRREKYFLNIQRQGLEIEEEISVIDPSLIFVKIHTPRTKIFHFATKYDIPLKKFSNTYFRPIVPSCKFMRTELTAQDSESPNYLRAQSTLSGDKPQRVLRNERFLVTYNILKRLQYGPHVRTDIGIHHLIEQRAFIAAYPPHDGTSKWNFNRLDPLNDRQLLRRYWSSPKNFFKKQPLDVIERYFGDNIALYFAWMSFYNKMLVVPIIIGLIVTILNAGAFIDDRTSIDEVCNSNMLICPSCNTCRAKPFNQSCSDYKLIYFIDTSPTFMYATLMSFWVAIYLILWKRKQAILAVRWNITDSSLEEHDVRPEFENFAKHAKMTELEEPILYIPFYIKFFRKGTSLLACILMTAMLLYIHFLLLTAECSMNIKVRDSAYATVTTAIATVLVIVLLRRVCTLVYEPIVAWLVDFEMPETQTDYDNSYILKIFVFSFVNNYTSMIYTSFFKGRFYTHPNDPEMYNPTIFLSIDQCDSAGCNVDVFVLHVLLIIALPILNHIANFIYTNIIVWAKKEKERKAKKRHLHIPRWERDFELRAVEPKDILKLYDEMVIQFGFITLFAFAFPMAPIFALINNFIKIHIDANKLVVKQRRPQAKRTANIGAWSDVMKFLTFLSVLTNVCFMIFTCKLVPKWFYAYYSQNHSFAGYENFTLSEYKINLNHWPSAGVSNGTTCFYRGMRHPSDSEKAYEFREEFYHLLATEAVIVIGFEHMILLLSLLVSYAIPSQPKIVRMKHAAEVMILRKHLNPTEDMIKESIIRPIK